MKFLLEHRRSVAYWITTVIIAGEMAAGSIWDLLRIDCSRRFRTAWLSTLSAHHLGVCKLPCAFALVAPRFARLKHWAYAGACFNLPCPSPVQAVSI